MPSWHAFLALGTIAAYFLSYDLVKKHNLGVSKSDSVKLFLIIYISGFVGSRLLAIYFVEQKFNILSLFRLGAMVLYGGILLGIIVTAIYVHFKKISKANLLDAVIPGLLLGISFGRIGCFLNGDDYGRPVKIVGDYAPWWAVSFPNLGDRVQQVYRYPVQLIESGICALICIILVLNFKRIRETLGSGAVGFIGLMSYSVLRFFDEYLRGDMRGWFVEGVLSPSQAISVVIFLFSLACFSVLNLRKN